MTEEALAVMHVGFCGCMIVAPTLPGKPEARKAPGMTWKSAAQIKAMSGGIVWAMRAAISRFSLLNPTLARK